jgi:hypothetical protein
MIKHRSALPTNPDTLTSKEALGLGWVCYISAVSKRVVLLGSIITKDSLEPQTWTRAHRGLWDSPSQSFLLACPIDFLLVGEIYLAPDPISLHQSCTGIAIWASCLRVAVVPLIQSATAGKRHSCHHYDASSSLTAHTPLKILLRKIPTIP